MYLSNLNLKKNYIKTNTIIITLWVYLTWFKPEPYKLFYDFNFYMKV